MAKRSPKWWREYFGFTVEHVADHLGIHKSNYSRKERGQTRFTLEEGFKLAALYKVPIEAIDFSAQEVAQTATSLEVIPPDPDPATPQK